MKKVDKKRSYFNKADDKWFDSIVEGQLQIMKTLLKHPKLTFDEIFDSLGLEFHDFSLAFLKLVSEGCIKAGENERYYIPRDFYRAEDGELAKSLMSWQPTINAKGSLE